MTARPHAAAAFRALHHADRVLLLPNVWDAASAALFAGAGAKAIATTSAGLAWACGFPDGDALPRASLLFAIASICRAAGELPVSADIESGYSDDPQHVAELVEALCGLGVAGINLEDGDGPPDLLAEKIRTVRTRLGEKGIDVFVNARTDVYLRDLATGDEAVPEAIDRATRYTAAGADGIFVPEVAEPDDIAAIAKRLKLPLNVLALAELPSARELYSLGVRRISAGALLAKYAYGAARVAATAFVRDGDCGVLFDENGLDYRETNALLAQGR